MIKEIREWIYLIILIIGVYFIATRILLKNPRAMNDVNKELAKLKKRKVNKNDLKKRSRASNIATVRRINKRLYKYFQQQ